MTPALARIKRAVREAIMRCGGVDGAGATAHRGRSVAGDWNNLNCAAFPPLDCVLALDEVVMADGHVPPIIAALAVELGGVFVPFIQCDAEEGSPAWLAMQLAQRLGDVSGEIARSLADDGLIDVAEANRVLCRLGDLDRVSGQLRQALRRIAEDDGRRIGDVPAVRGCVAK